MSMEQFFTRDRANCGRKITLTDPTGKPTDEWLLIRHIWSDAFQLAEEAALREARDMIMAMGEDKDEQALADIRRDAKTKLLASLVARWSFDQECTSEAAFQFLYSAPQIAEQIDKVSADGKAFFGEESNS